MDSVTIFLGRPRFLGSDLSSAEALAAFLAAGFLAFSAAGLLGLRRRGGDLLQGLRHKAVEVEVLGIERGLDLSHVAFGGGAEPGLADAGLLEAGHVGEVGVRLSDVGPLKDVEGACHEGACHERFVERKRRSGRRRRGWERAPLSRSCRRGASSTWWSDHRRDRRSRRLGRGPGRSGTRSSVFLKARGKATTRKEGGRTSSMFPLQDPLHLQSRLEFLSSIL